MANNYTQFSFVVKTTEEQKDWLTEKHNNCGEFGGGAAVVSRTSIGSFTTGDLRAKLEAAFAKDTNVAPRPN